MSKSFKIIFSVLVISGLAIAAFFYAPILESSFHEAISDVMGTATSTLALTNQQALTRSGVISLTNNEREKAGLAALTENVKLDAAAEAKLNDMFKQQYFEHVNPQGVGPGDVAHNAGYQYLVEGENLALGNFDSNVELLAAWMASPEHKANILNVKFTEMGAAVGEGMYQGKEEWLAVQEFGEPESNCPSVDASLKTKVDADQNAVDNMSSDLAAKKQELDSMPTNTPGQQNAYNQSADAYNKEVAEYDSMQANLKSEIATYNAEVVAFNACLAK